MPDRTRARVLVTALLIVLTVAGVRAIGPPGDWGRPATDAVAGGCVLAVVIAGLFAALNWRYRPASELAGKLHKIVSSALVASLVLVLIVVGLAVYNRTPRQPVTAKPIRVHLPRFPPGLNKPEKIVIAHGVLLRDLLIAVVIAAIIVIAAVAWQRRRRSLRFGDFGDLIVDEAQDDLARAVESGRVALRELDDARAAIIACYVAMEQSLATAGTAREAAETPDELLARAVAADLVSQVPAGLLTGLFYEARFSTHPMPMSQRDLAEHALAELAAGLPAGELR